MAGSEDTTKGRKTPEEPEQDVEGHNLWISPSTGRDLARGRNADIERQARERQRAKEARGQR
jgi:hypothetical protein